MNYTYITGDTHGNWDIRKLDRIAMNKKLTRDDVLIIAGDWGVLWGPGRKYDIQEKMLLEWYGKFKCTILIVDGNHDNHTRFNALPTIIKYGEEVGVIADNIFHLRRGHIYVINDRKYFIFGGALSIDKAERILGIDYWTEELPTRDQMDKAYDSLDRHDYMVDYVITHTAPRGVLNKMGFTLDWVDAEKYNDPTAMFLESLSKQITFDKWYFGHMHVDREITHDGLYRCLYQGVVNMEDEEGLL
ncbi:MAG: metallophosphoesterase [Candidatus Brocadiales bacterium]|nr:metallophosphoesterase [Candidatus Brocadiales bacterium]